MRFYCSLIIVDKMVCVLEGPLHAVLVPSPNPSSAKTKDGVQEAFEELVQKVLQTPTLYTTDTSSSDGFNVARNSEQPQEDWCGC